MTDHIKNIDIVKDSNDHYHSHNSISASGLKKIFNKSVHHYLETTYKESDAMRLGTAVHVALLEREVFYDIYCPMTEKIDARTKEGKLKKAAFEEKSEGKIVLSLQEYEVIKGINARFDKNKLAKHYCKGDKELSHYLKFEGVDVRVRPDCINYLSGFISDVKTTRLSANEEDFSSEAETRDYDLQAAFYMDMLGIDTFKFIVCEKSPPYSVMVHTLDEESIERGRQKYKIAFSDWKDYVKSGKITSFKARKYAADGSFLISTKKWKKLREL